MGTASISGLASGLDTATIISQLMQLEAQPQTNLKTKLSTEQSTVKTLQDLNAKVAALATQATALAGSTGFGLLTATSSSKDVTVVPRTGTTTGSLAFTVDQTALAHRLTFLDTARGTDVVVSPGTTVQLHRDGVTTTLDTGDGTLDGLVAALNATGTGVQATTLKLDDGTSRLLVTAEHTGAANDFTLTASDGSTLLGGAAVTAGRDAAITIGTDTVHAATNTFTDLLPGVDVTVSAAAVGTTVDIAVGRDTTKVKDAAKALVEAVNGLLTQIDALTAYDPVKKTSGPLAGDPGLRQLRSDLLNSIYPGDNTTLADVGLQTDRYGKLVFDADRFAAAYAEDPGRVTDRFGAVGGDGFAARIGAAATAASDKYDGTLTTAITGRNTQIGRLQDSIDDWDRRLELRRTALQRQFTALETALGQMQSQSTWLASQLAGLTSNQE